MHKIGLPNGKQKFFINPKNANSVKLLINCSGYVPNCEQGNNHANMLFVYGYLKVLKTETMHAVLLILLPVLL